MNLEFLAFLLPWLGTLLESATGTDHSSTHHSQNLSTETAILPRHPHWTYQPRTDRRVLSNELWQVCRPDWDTDRQLVCRRHGYRDLLLPHREEWGWSVYCPLQRSGGIPTLKNGRCYATPRDSSCTGPGYRYVGHICEFPRHPSPEQDALSNQSSDDGADIDAGGFAYLAIAIFLCAFLFPCVLGVCCFYWGEDAEGHRHDEHQHEQLENGVTHLPKVISVSGVDNSGSVDSIQGTESSPPPSYDSCNNPIEEGDAAV